MAVLGTGNPILKKRKSPSSNKAHILVDKMAIDEQTS